MDFPQALLDRIPTAQRDALMGVLSQDPRPSYQDDPERIYGVAFAGFNVRFTVSGRRLSVCGVEGLDGR